MFQSCWWNRSPGCAPKLLAQYHIRQSVLYSQDYLFNGCSGGSNGCEKRAKCAVACGNGFDRVPSGSGAVLACLMPVLHFGPGVGQRQLESLAVEDVDVLVRHGVR